MQANPPLWLLSSNGLKSLQTCLLYWNTLTQNESVGLGLTLHLSSAVVWLFCILLVLHVHASLRACAHRKFGKCHLDYGLVSTVQEVVTVYLKRYPSTSVKGLRKIKASVIEVLVSCPTFVPPISWIYSSYIIFVKLHYLIEIMFCSTQFHWLACLNPPSMLITNVFFFLKQY